MTRHRPVFGRKQSVAPPGVAPHAVANDAPAKRILPEDLWDGPAGGTLREAGLEPDSPTNHRMTQADADARQREEIEWQRGFLMKVNSQLPSGTAVVAYAMLPWDLWIGPFGEMLSVTCGLWPTQKWNTMLLADDQRSSTALDLPEHPGGYPANLIPDLERLLAELREGMDAEMARTKATPTLASDTIEAWEAARVAMIPRIFALSLYVGQMCIGEEAFARHKQMFGDTLGWPGSH